MAAFPVPEQLAGTAACEPTVQERLAGLPQVVVGLADRWSVSVGEPFEPEQDVVVAGLTALT